MAIPIIIGALAAVGKAVTFGALAGTAATAVGGAVVAGTTVGGGLLVRAMMDDGGGEAYSNKKLVLIGLPASGKTTLSTFMAKGELPGKTEPTYTPQIRSMDGEVAKHFNISIDIIHDMRTNPGGASDGLDPTDIRKEVEYCDYILYLFDASNFTPNNEKKIKDELNFFSQRVLKGRGYGKKFIAVGTHTDKMSVQPESTSMHTSIVNYLRSFDDVCKHGLVYGALNSKENALNLSKAIANKIDNL